MHTLQQLLSGALKGSRHVKLSCGLTEFPRELFSLEESLEILDLSANHLSELPDDFGRFSQLKIAFFSDNLFTELPVVLGDCRQLSMIGFKSNQIAAVPEHALPVTTRWLILTNNRITKLPASIGDCRPLQKAALAGNQLTALPPEMAKCRNLELLRISANKFDTLPDWLLNLPKLSWLAFSGNPFSFKKEKLGVLDEADWQEFELIEQLGEGASGNIYKARWLKHPLHKEVAVKVFKGEVTSDGFPEDEMDASIAAGIHPNLVKLFSKIKNHPGKKQGLVMELIPPSFYNLGLPPSLDSCSRDVFPSGVVFTGREILQIADAIASAVSHLHALGICHGDLYAHNILIDKNPESLISDFGAASFYDRGNSQAKKIQQIECRAFGCLLDDLLMHLAKDDRLSELARSLEQLRTELMTEDAGLRPLFAELSSRLKMLRQEPL